MKKLFTWFTLLLLTLQTTFWIYTSVDLVWNKNTNTLIFPNSISADSSWNIYIADSGKHILYKANSDGSNLQIIAWSWTNSITDWATATDVYFAWWPTGVTVWNNWDIYTIDGDSIYKISTDGKIYIVANTNNDSWDIDWSALTAKLNTPQRLFYTAWILYIADSWNNKIKKLESWNITTIAWTWESGFSWDNSNPLSAKLNWPKWVFVKWNDIYIADTYNNRIRKISGWVITTVAWWWESIADWVWILSWKLINPENIYLDNDSVYISDVDNNRIVLSNGTTLTNQSDINEDIFPTDFWINGNIKIFADGVNHRIAKFDIPVVVIPTQTISSWWGGWVWLSMDYCINWDKSVSYYDKTCWDENTSSWNMIIQSWSLKQYWNVSSNKWNIWENKKSNVEIQNKIKIVKKNIVNFIIKKTNNKPSKEIIKETKYIFDNLDKYFATDSFDLKKQYKKEIINWVNNLNKLLKNKVKSLK